MTADTNPDAFRARNHVEAGAISESLAYGQIAVAENLGAIQSTLADLTGLAAKALGVVLDGNDIATRIPPRTDLVERLADILRETYESHEYGPVWPVLATAALEFMED